MDHVNAWKDKLGAMSGAPHQIRCWIRFSEAEVTRLQQGLWPRDMDDRWVVWLDDGVLRCWRSWTGTCVYEAIVHRQADGSGEVLLLNVLNQPDHYCRASNDEDELSRFDAVTRTIWR